MLGKGRAAALKRDDLERAALELKCHPADLEAIAKVESAGFGWHKDGRMKILPEPHKFNAYLAKNRKAKARQLGLTTSSYKATRASGHYKRMRGPGPRYDLLERWIDFDRRAAFMAISMGTYQIMGFNYRACGYSSAEAMFNDFLTGEAAQLQALIAFLRSRRLVVAVRNRDFELIEKRYNGGGQGGAYARKMRAWSAKLRAGKWSGWNPSKAEAATEVSPTDTAPAPRLPETPAFKPAPRPPQKPQERRKPPAATVAPAKPNTGKAGLVAAVAAALAAVSAGMAAGWDKLLSWFGG